MDSKDVEITGESGTVYRFNFGTNACCRVETITGISYVEVVSQLKVAAPHVALVRQFVKGTIVQPIGLTDDQIGDLIDDMGGWGVIVSSLRKDDAELLKALDALRASFPEPTSDVPIDPAVH
jgi:hypothetical protein